VLPVSRRACLGSVKSVNYRFKLGELKLAREVEENVSTSSIFAVCSGFGFCSDAERGCAQTATRD